LPHYIKMIAEVSCVGGISLRKTSLKVLKELLEI